MGHHSSYFLFFYFIFFLVAMVAPSLSDSTHVLLNSLSALICLIGLIRGSIGFQSSIQTLLITGTPFVFYAVAWGRIDFIAFTHCLERVQ
jgi:hypothetical protein